MSRRARASLSNCQLTDVTAQAEANGSLSIGGGSVVEGCSVSGWDNCSVSVHGTVTSTSVSGHLGTHVSAGGTVEGCSLSCSGPFSELSVSGSVFDSNIRGGSSAYVTVSAHLFDTDVSSGGGPGNVSVVESTIEGGRVFCDDESWCSVRRSVITGSPGTAVRAYGGSHMRVENTVLSGNDDGACATTGPSARSSIPRSAAIETPPSGAEKTPL